MVNRPGNIQRFELDATVPCHFQAEPHSPPAGLAKDGMSVLLAVGSEAV